MGTQDWLRKMRDILSECVFEILPPAPDERLKAAHGEATGERHSRYLADWRCLQTLELAPPPAAFSNPSEMKIAAWNMERCKRVEDSADLLRRAGVDIVLATEMDYGMARSGQRHTTRDLARLLGFGYVYGVEFVELGTGDTYETRLFSDVANHAGLHGNAILSRFPLHRPRVIPLDDQGHWFTGSPKSDGQRRVGGRMAIAADVEVGPAPITLVAVHFESESDAQGRLQQAETMLSALCRVYGPAPMIIGGDLNTADLAGRSVFSCLNQPQIWEPCFGAFEADGFGWKTANNGEPTTRAAPGKPVDYPLKRLDWLFVRGLDSLEPMTVPAISSHGDYLSDHELVTAWFMP